MIHFLVYRKRIIIFVSKCGGSFEYFELHNARTNFNKIEH